MVGLLSAAGLVGFLSEPDPELQVFALGAANDSMSSLWTGLADAVGQIEALYEDESFPERQLAALVASKIYYHLQEYDESMTFALGAGKLFEIDKGGEFEDTIIAKCIDTYMSQSAADKTPNEGPAQQNPGLNSALTDKGDGSANTAAGLTSPVTPFSQSALPSKSLLSRQDSTAAQYTADNSIVNDLSSPQSGLRLGLQKSLQAVIRRIFERCFQEGAYRQVVGIAVEAKNLEVLRETITRASGENDKHLKPNSAVRIGKKEELMDYLLDVCMNIVQERDLRNQILQLILNLLESNDVSNPDYFSIAKCIVYLGQSSMAANLLQQLAGQGDAKALATAYQIAFDIYDNGTQDFRRKVMDELPQTEDKEPGFALANGNSTQPNSQENAEESDQLLSAPDASGAAASTSTIVSRTKKSSLSDEQKKIYSSIRDILGGNKGLEFNLEFLYRSNKSDRHVLTKLKNSLEARNSIFHSAVTFANAFTNSGTANDWFIRENLDWLNKAVNWSKFSVTAALGVIHRGNIGQGRKLLEPYLRDSTSGAGSTYSKGGALYGLGLIYTNHGKHVLEYLFEQLKSATDEVIQHGAALGVGVAGMATEDGDLIEHIKNTLWTDSAISGQAAGLSMGLVLLGSGDVNALKDMVQYARETEHEKTIRGLALGMGLIMYGRQEAADDLINGLLDDPDPILRYGGIMTIALAYCGTSSNKAVRKLLHVAVSDVNDDVRRIAVTSLGFVLFRKPGAVPRMVELLAESYNPHVRYGATMALGIACAGTGLEGAVDLLEPMMKDSTDFVRQGTSIALAMIMVQQSEAVSPKAVSIRKHLLKVVSDRHEDAMAKFGASLALGIIDAGGRNCNIGLQTQTGNLNMTAIVGMAIFIQYWYWFPFTHFLALSFTPTSVIGVDQELEVPSIKLHCAARPSTFEYPPSMEVKQEEAPEKVKTAVLSTTAQAKRRRLAKERDQKKGEGMDIDLQPTTPKEGGPEDDKMDMEDESGKDRDEREAESDGKAREGDSTPSGKPKQKAEKEKVGFEIENMSRVLPGQLKVTTFPEGRYVPVKKPSGGVVLLEDTQPSEPKHLIERQIKKAAPRAQAGQQGQSATAQTPIGQREQQAEVAGGDAAAVLNAVDEDEEGAPEAECPGEFDYESNGEGGGEDEG